MRRAEVLQIVARHEAELSAMGVRSLAIFGSVARDQAGPTSDVDLLVEFDRPVGYFHVFDVQDRLETSSVARWTSSPAAACARRFAMASWRRPSVPPSRGWALRVRDIVGAVDRISRYTAGMTQGQFARDEKTVEAVCFALRRRPCACTGPGGRPSLVRVRRVQRRRGRRPDRRPRTCARDPEVRRKRRGSSRRHTLGPPGARRVLEGGPMSVDAGPIALAERVLADALKKPMKAAFIHLPIRGEMARVQIA
jgi:predicted nucleotidyltransferase